VKAFLHRAAAGFTLVEMLVSMAILAIILAVLAQVTGALQVSVTQTTSAVHEFEAARDAFEVMTRRISQATLNSYYDRATNTGLTVPGYTRASELRFISGPASLSSTSLAQTSSPLFSGTNPYHPSNAIFFQAPLGKFSNSALNSTPTISRLVQAMNTCGYFIEWNNDSSQSGGLNIVPPFISNYTPRWRYRLMEMIEPSDNLTIYSYTSGGANISNSWTYSGKDWFQTPYQNSLSSSSVDYQCARPIADNVICLAFLPMLAPQNAQYPQGGAPDGTSTDLMASPSGQAGSLYDTSPPSGGGTPPLSMNQLPPMVYVLMIAVDENSFARYQALRGTSAMSTIPSNLGIDSPGGNQGFLTVSTYAARQDPTSGDISKVVAALNANRIRYRIFSTTVTLTAH
jgi:uncharacterized protein (TIGR02599 family)